MSRLLLPVFVFFGLLGACAGPQRADEGTAEPLRIACIGDSITEGNANPDHRRNSWPLILGRLLEGEFPGAYESANFGRSGATLLRAGRKPYWDQDVREKSVAFEPDIVVINLGTNDATEANWQGGDDFERDMRELIALYRELPSRPRILLSNLTPMYSPHPRVEECAPNRVVIERIIGELAQELALEVIDFKTPTSGVPELMPDGLHPNTKGNELMAQAAFEAIAGGSAPSDPSLRPRRPEGEARVLIEAGNVSDVRLGTWRQEGGVVEGTGARKTLDSKVAVLEGDFLIRARLRMIGQKNSAAGFFINGNFFGFEGARGTVFRNGPEMGGGLRLLHPAERLWERDAWIDFEVVRNGEMVWFLVDGFVVEMASIPGPIERFGFDPTRSRMQISDWSIVGNTVDIRPEVLDRRTVNTPWIDLTWREDLWEEEETPGYRYCPNPFATVPSPNGAGELTIFSLDTDGHASFGRVGSERFELSASLTGESHYAAYLADGRLLIVFRDLHPSSPTFGDLVAWVGTFDDVVQQREGEFTCRLRELDPEADVDLLGLSVGEDGAIEVICQLPPDENEQRSLGRARFSLADMRELLPRRGYDIPIVDLDADVGRHVVVDREEGQYLGHVTTELLEDGKTILAVYPKGHGRGPIVYKRSSDGGRTWSERLPTPENWVTSREVPTIHRVIDPENGKKRLIVWSGLYPARLAVSEDDGASWSELKDAGEWGGIVVMGFVERLRDGAYLAMFHDGGRFFTADGVRADPVVFTLYQTRSEDGGLTWSEPEVVWSGSDVHLCEPGVVRSPDGTTLAVLLRENSRRRNGYVIFSEDEGATWSAPRELPASLTGDRHTAAYGPDGRLFISFRDTSHESSTQGDWVGWVGTWEDIRAGKPGQYRVRLKDNKHRWDTTYPGVEVLPDGTFVVTTYGHWDEGKQPYILSARFTLDELDARAELLPRKATLFEQGMGGVHTYRIPALVTTNSGVLIAACDARTKSGRDLPNHIETVIRRSFDGGKTWSDIETVIGWPETEGAADPCLLVDRETGRVLCAITWSSGVGWRDSRPGFGADSFHCLIVSSDDDGASWSEPIDITESVKSASWRSAWFSPGVGLQTKSGRLLLPFSAADGAGKAGSYAAVSDDHGATWKRVGPLGTNTNESMVVQRADGRLVCSLRSTHGFNRRGVSFSTDDGDRWSALEHDDELIEPVCQASLLTVPAELTPDGREWLVFCNPASTKREQLTLRVSFDGGETWPVRRLLQAGPTAYSCMTLLPDGGIGVLYERGDTHAYERITFASVSLEWLAAGDVVGEAR